MSVRRAVFAIAVWLVAGAATVFAQDYSVSPAPVFENLERYLPATVSQDSWFMLPSADARELPRRPWLLDRWPLDRWEPHRPDRFETLCLTLAGLSVIDTVMTSRALGDGSGQELNPMLAPFASNTFALAASKAALDGAAIYLARRIWHRDQDRAIHVLIASNAVVGAAIVKNAVIGPPPIPK